MAKEILTLSALIIAVFLVRVIFKNRIPKRMVYALWLVVLLKLCLPGTLVSLPVLPAEKPAIPVQRAELPTQTAPVIQQPAQAAAQPQVPAQQTTTPAQEAVKPTERPLTAMQILQIVWGCGSVLLGLWFFIAWLVFTVRLHRNRRFLGKRGRISIFVSNAIKSPCLAGLIPAVYLTDSVLGTDEAELILQHELTHLRHLDFIWSLCRTLAVIAYWWNPLIWLAAVCSRRDAELACDEAVAAKLSDSERITYARVILEQAPRRATALSLAGPPVRERILFLTKKQRISVLCIVLALVLVVSAAGCSFAELTRQKTGEITLPEAEKTAHQETPKTAAPLTQEQIDAVNDAFVCDRADGDETLGHFAVNGFFTSTYDDVRNLNLKKFLAYFGECGEEDITEEEFAQLKTKWNSQLDSAADFPLPIHRYPASAVEQVLRRFAGIGLADLKDIQEPFSGYTYLEETDAFYNTTSDYSPGYFVCTGGEADPDGEYALLYGSTAGRFSGEAVLELVKDGENWYIHSFTVMAPDEPAADETELPTTESLPPVLLRQELNMRKEASFGAAFCDGWPLKKGEYVTVLAERTVDGQLWYQVRCTRFEAQADNTGWLPAVETEPYTVSNMWDCTVPLYLVSGAQYYDGTGAHTLTDADPRGPFRITGYDEANYRYQLSGTGGMQIEVGGRDMLECPPLPADDPDTIAYQVQQKLAHASWAQEMTTDYEDQIRRFEGADYRDGWGIGQYPHYYRALAEFFTDFTTERAFLSTQSIWARDVIEDGTVLQFSMQLGEKALGLYYSVFTHALCVAPDAYRSFSEQELAQLRHDFFGADGGLNMRGMMLTSAYDDVRNIDLSRLFYNGVYGGENALSDAERAAVIQAEPSAEHLDITKITRTQMNAVLKEHAGLTLKQSAQLGLDQFIYLASYDAYYLAHSDAIDPRCEVLSGRWISNTKALLICRVDGQTTAATLQKTDNGWRFISNMLVYL